MQETARRRDVATRFRQNLGDTACRVLLFASCLVQATDAVTTAVGLRRAGLFEANLLMRHAVTSPLALGVLKVILVMLVCAVALLRLPTRRARIALLVAVLLGVVAPIENIIQLSTP